MKDSNCNITSIFIVHGLMKHFLVARDFSNIANDYGYMILVCIPSTKMFGGTLGIMAVTSYDVINMAPISQH